MTLEPSASFTPAVKTPFSDQVASFLAATGPVLSLDIGSGTQDVLLAQPGQQAENWPRFVLPSPAVTIANMVTAHTAAKRPIWLHGLNMGGGFAGAVRRHLAAGLAVSATCAASAALHDDPERVRTMGITLTETCPKGHAAVRLADYEPGFWQTFLSAAGLPTPALVVAAVQDHGVSCLAEDHGVSCFIKDHGVSCLAEDHGVSCVQKAHGVSCSGTPSTPPPAGNREGRFRLWKSLLEQTRGNATHWVYDAPPAACTRLAALHACTGGPVADTATAAVLGALSTPEVIQRSQRQGVTIVNVGNSHIVAFLLYKNLIYGIYEQHTGLRSLDELLHDLKEFRFGWLPDEVVRNQGGHGTAFLKQAEHENAAESLPAEAEGFAPTFITGPQREQLRGHGQFIAPHGDMMLAGAYGLLFALAQRG